MNNTEKQTKKLTVEEYLGIPAGTYVRPTMEELQEMMERDRDWS